MLTYKESMNKFFDTVSRVNIFVEGRGEAVTVRAREMQKIPVKISVIRLGRV